MKKNLLILAATFMIIGCSKNTQKSLGIIETMPDEYKVKRNKALEVPPSYSGSISKSSAENSELSKAEKTLLTKIK